MNEKQDAFKENMAAKKEQLKANAETKVNEGISKGQEKIKKSELIQNFAQKDEVTAGMIKEVTDNNLTVFEMMRVASKNANNTYDSLKIQMELNRDEMGLGSLNVKAEQLTDQQIKQLQMEADLVQLDNLKQISEIQDLPIDEQLEKLMKSCEYDSDD